MEANTMAPAFEKGKGFYSKVDLQGDRKQSSSLSLTEGLLVTFKGINKEVMYIL